MDPRFTRILIGIATAIVVLLIAVVVMLATGEDTHEAATTVTTAAITTTTPETTAPDTSSSTITTVATTTAAPTTTAAATTTAAPTTTTTTTTAPAGPCSGLPTAGGAAATDQTVAWGDVDGDGSDDEIVVYQAAGTWWLNVGLAYGWATEIPLPGMFAKAVDVVNLGVDEEVVIAQTDAGASVEIFGIFAFQNCSIVHIIDGTTGFETAFPVGGGVTHLDGFTCTADGIKVTSALNDLDHPELWEYTETDYLYVPGLGEMQPLASSVQVLTSPGDDATIFGAGTYGC